MLAGYEDTKIWWNSQKMHHIAMPAAQNSPPSQYRALQRYADGYPVAKTGQCSAIPAGYRISMVRAFIAYSSADQLRFAPVNRTSALVAIGAAKAGLTPGVIDPLDATARLMARQILDRKHRDMFVPCHPKAQDQRDDSCARAFLSGAGRRLYRRPPTQSELAAAVAMAGQAFKPTGDFYSGLAFSLGGMLVSPQFLFITETIQSDTGQSDTGQSGAGQTGAGATRSLDGYSRASRLIFLLWDSAPDEELLQAAASGGLANPAALRRQVARMMASPRLERGVRAFFQRFSGA